MAQERPIYLVDKIVHELYKVIWDLCTHGSQQRWITPWVCKALDKCKVAHEQQVSIFLSIYQLAGFFIPSSTQTIVKKHIKILKIQMHVLSAIQRPLFYLSHARAELNWLFRLSTVFNWRMTCPACKESHWSLWQLCPILLWCRESPDSTKQSFRRVTKSSKPLCLSLNVQVIYAYQSPKSTDAMPLYTGERGRLHVYVTMFRVKTLKTRGGVITEPTKL